MKTRKKGADRGRLAFLRFFSQAWFGDTTLRACSVAARGLWIDLILLMHQDGEPYGHLAKNGVAMSRSDLAKVANIGGRTLDKLMKELEDRGVFSRDDSGVIYSRKLVRDEANRVTAQHFGKRGGNPALKRRVKERVNPVGLTPPLDTRVPEYQSSSSTEIPTGLPVVVPTERDILAKQDFLRGMGVGA